MRQEIADAISNGTRDDTWLAVSPPELEWGNDIAPGGVDPSDPIVQCVMDAATALGGMREIGRLDSWHDAASLNRVGGIPTVAFGVSNADLEGRSLMHAVDENVLVDELVACAKVLALSALRFT